MGGPVPEHRNIRSWSFRSDRPGRSRESRPLPSNRLPVAARSDSARRDRIGRRRIGVGSTILESFEDEGRARRRHTGDVLHPRRHDLREMRHVVRHHLDLDVAVAGADPATDDVVDGAERVAEARAIARWISMSISNRSRGSTSGGAPSERCCISAITPISSTVALRHAGSPDGASSARITSMSAITSRRLGFATIGVSGAGPGGAARRRGREGRPRSRAVVPPWWARLMRRGTMALVAR